MRCKRTIVVMLSIMLVMGLVPMAGNEVSAAPYLEILNYSQNQASPEQVTSQFIELDVEFSDIPTADLGQLYYVVQEVNTGIVREIKDNRAVQTDISQRVKFRNVELAEGLNRITVMLDSQTSPQSLPVYVHFTSVTSVRNLEIDRQPFTQNIMVPERNPLPGLAHVLISGEAPNAHQIQATTTLNPGGVRASFFVRDSGLFSFDGGNQQYSELNFRAGDNDLIIMAENPLKTYRTSRQFVFNDGGSFLYNTVINAVDKLAMPEDPYLFRNPKLEATEETGPFTFDIKTNIKINRETANRLSHDELQLEIDGTNQTYTVQFRDVNETARTVNYWITDPDGNVTSGTVNQIERTSEYYMFPDFIIPGIELDRTRPDQLIDVRFVPRPGHAASEQNFSLKFVNQHEPYVESIRLAGSGNYLYSGIQVNVSSETLDILVEVTNDADSVRVYSGNKGGAHLIESSTTESHTFDGVTASYFKVSLDRSLLMEGQDRLLFIPVKAGTEYRAGSESILIQYNPAPYVYVKNIHSGQIFNDQLASPIGIDSNGVTFNGPIFQIVPVNIPDSQFGDIRVIWRDQIDVIRSQDHYSENGQFKEFQFKFGPGSGVTSRQGNEWLMASGLNELKIEVYPQGTLDSNGRVANNIPPMTTFRYELFYFTDELPEVSNLEIDPDFRNDHKFVSVDGESRRFFTQERAVRARATIANANQVFIEYKHYDTRGGSVTSSAEIRVNASGQFYIYQDPDDMLGSSGIQTSSATINGNATGTIRTESLPLNGTGVNSIEIIAVNAAGNHRTNILEIVREPASFIVHYPIIDPETKVGGVNGNFTALYVEAENADKIVYGRNQEVTQTQTMRIGGEDREVFVFEINGLRRGTNDIEFTVIRGDQEEEAEITLVNADTVAVGGQYKDTISNGRIRAFDRQLELNFPRGTVLKRNSDSAPDQALAPDREIFIGIADPIDGRVNKTLRPAFNEQSKFQLDWHENYSSRLNSPFSRFRQVSPMFWIDAGMVEVDYDMAGRTQEANLHGSGSYPYERGKEFFLRGPHNKDQMFVPSRPGTLTLQYDANLVQSAWRYVTVFHYGYNFDYTGTPRFEWRNIGGVVDQRSNTITVPIEEFGYYKVMYMDHTFEDITGHPWARNYLDTLYSKGFMRPLAGERFDTISPISRGEFTTLIAKAFELPLNYEGTPTFRDVTPNAVNLTGDYEYKYIETAARAGIVRGVIDRAFHPSGNLTREDAAVIIARAANKRLNSNTSKVMSDLEKSFTDAGNINEYARASVLAIATSRPPIITGKPNVTSDNQNETFYFDPRANLTRAEAAVIIMNVLLDQKKIPSL